MKNKAQGIILLLIFLISFFPLSIIEAKENGNIGVDDIDGDNNLPDIDSIKEAIYEAIDKSTALYVFIYDIEIHKVSISDDFALAILYYYDKLTGDLIIGEPGFVLVKKEENAWKAVLPDDENWNNLLLSTPDNLVPPDLKSYLKISENDLRAELDAYGGYLLPWEGGKTRTLSRSIFHGAGDSYYAFDFYDAADRYFVLTASRPGVVWYARWDVPRDEGDCEAYINTVNYIVIKNDIGLYDLYLHLDYNSIPAHLRTRGNPVVRGEKVGNADTTGCCTGAHLHFMAHTTSTSYWGQSVDITFSDVNVCDGRPRTPAEASCGQTYYTSGNYLDITPPTNPTTISPGCTATSGEWQNTCNDPSFSWSGATDNASGVAGYYYYWGTSSTGTSTSYTTSTSYNPPAVGEGTYYFRISTKDNRGNTAPWQTMFILKYDGTKPTGTLKINDGIATTYKTQVTLHPTAADNLSGVKSIRFRDQGGVWTDWQGVSDIKWLLPAVTDLTYRVEGEVIDRAGNNSLVFFDDIYLDIYPDRPFSSNYSLIKSTFGMSGTNASSSLYKLQGTLSQNSTGGTSTSENYQVASGYWAWILGVIQDIKDFFIYLPLLLK